MTRITRHVHDGTTVVVDAVAFLAFRRVEASRLKIPGMMDSRELGLMRECVMTRYTGYTDVPARVRLPVTELAVCRGEIFCFEIEPVACGIRGNELHAVRKRIMAAETGDAAAPSSEGSAVA